MNRQTLIIIVAGILIAIATVWWFQRTFEYRTQEQEVGFEGEARRNVYLAAERFLQKYNMTVKSIPTVLDMKRMPSPDDVLFIPTARYDLSPEKIQELLSWVEQGGHLIARARRMGSTIAGPKDELFNALGVQTYVKSGNKPVVSDKSGVIDVHVNPGVEDKKVEFNMNRWMKDTGKHELSWSVTGANGSQLLEYSIGKGYVTLLSDIRFLTNSHIADNDHAAFVYTLVHLDNRNRNIWIVRNGNMPSLLRIMSEKLTASLVASGVFILFWLWNITRRFGPVRSGEVTVRRSLREHITATGLFHWRNRNRSALFMGAKTALLEQISQARPLWTRLAQADLAGKLAKISNISPAKVLLVLQTDKADKEADFTQYIEIISMIRKRL